MCVQKRRGTCKFMCCTQGTTNMWRPVDNFWELFLFFPLLEVGSLVVSAIGLCTRGLLASELLDDSLVLGSHLVDIALGYVLLHQTFVWF